MNTSVCSSSVNTSSTSLEAGCMPGISCLRVKVYSLFCVQR